MPTNKRSDRTIRSLVLGARLLEKEYNRLYLAVERQRVALLRPSLLVSKKYTVLKCVLLRRNNIRTL